LISSALTWQKEIDDKQVVLDKMYRDFEGRTGYAERRTQKEKRGRIICTEKELRDLQRKRFGYEGDLFKKRQELVKPIQDKVYNAIQKIAVSRSFDFILDKSEGITDIFADPN
jgi:outer membrane protein